MGADLYNESYAKKNEAISHIKAEADALWKQLDKLRRSGADEATVEAARTEWSKVYWKLMEEPKYYFRESYGGEGLLSLMGLSWWQDVIPLIDIEPPAGLEDEQLEEWYEANPNNMSPEACQRFIDLLQANRAIVDAYPEDEWEEGADWLSGEHYRTNVGEWYRERFNHLIEFLRTGVEYGGISASL